MNILFLSPESPYPLDHGHHLRSFNVLKLLADENQIFFFAFAKRKQELEYKVELEKYCRSVDLLLVPEGKWRWRLFLSLVINLFSPLPYTVERYIHKEAKQRIRQILDENEIDLVHIDMLHLGTYYKVVAQLPKVLVNHNVESLRLLRWAQNEKNIILKLYLYLQYIKLYYFEKNICTKFDMCNVVSDYDKDILLKMCPNTKFVTIPNGVDIEYFKPTNGEYVENSLLWVGGMADPHNKNAVNYFLNEILPLIQLKIPDVKVNIIGDVPSSELLKKSKENPNIKALGYVDDVRPFMQRALVIIVPLLSGSGTKLKVLNALSVGKAVVTTTIGAEGIKVTNNENIIIADDPKEYADKTVYLLKNTKIAMKMGENARILIEKYYDWKIIGEKMHKAYNEVNQNLA